MADAPADMTKAELLDEVRRLRHLAESDLEIRRLIEELATHQVELKQQQVELQEAHAALEQSRDRYAALFDFAPVGFLSLTADGLVEEVNLTAANLLGVERMRLHGSPLVLHVESSDRRRFLDHLLRSRSGERVVRTDLLLRGRSEPIPVEITTKRMEQGDRVFFYTAIVDVTERLQHEADRLAAEREHQRILRENESAKAAGEAKDQFLAVLSHELRTPLAPILFGLAEIEGEHGVPESVAAVLAMIRRNIELEAHLIDDLLDVTRITRGKLAIELQPLDVHELIADVARPSHFRSRAADLTFALDLRAEHHFVRGDPTRLRQVLWNLLENALRHTPQGGTVTLRCEDAPDRHVRIVVSDTGAGIAPADLERIFAPFDQGGGPRRPGGLGLGLSISRGLVEAHGGKISGHSGGPGTGARFEIELPTTDRPPARARGDSGDACAEPKNTPLRLLLVEDHVDTAEALATYLRGRGYRVALAHSVADTDRFSPADFDVLLSDLQLPDGSGLELLASLRRRGPVRAIAMSGFGTEVDRRRSQEAGFARHLVKPVDVRAVLDAIESVAKA
jgi:PAS domain S-box-containing protein